MTEQIIDVILLTLVTITAIAVVEMRSLLAATMVSGIYSLLMALMWMNLNAVDVAFTEAAVGAGISTVLLLGALVIVGKDERPGRRVHGAGLLVVLITGAVLIYGTADIPPFGGANTPVQTHSLKNVYTNQLPSKAALRESAGGAPAGEITPFHHEPKKFAAPNAPALPKTVSGSTHAAADKTGAHSASAGGHHRADYFAGHSPNMVTAVIVSYRGFDTMFETAVIFTAALSLIMLLRGRGQANASTPHKENG